MDTDDRFGAGPAAIGGRVLAIDLGDARIGLALSDPLGIAATPRGFVPVDRKGAHLDALVRVVNDESVETVVVGLPLHMSGEEGERARGARAFAETLGRRLGDDRDVRIELWDERLTTVEAERALIGAGVKRRKRRRTVDGVAAAILLQSYLAARASPIR